MSISIPERTQNYYDKLYFYQKDSVDFLLNAFKSSTGGALIAHSVGLGKTLISAVFLSSIFENYIGRFYLIVAPKSVIV